MTTEYTWQEVAKHNHEKDLWIVYNNGVYDLTKFLTEHPGGEEALIDSAGKDGTKCFDEIGHTTEAAQLRESYKIGVVKGPSPAGTTESGGEGPSGDDDETVWGQEPVKNESNSSLPLVVAAGIAVYGFIFYYFWFS
ncbi:cytochrome b5 [Halictus rubicundus]|uniref:cytochrome b5 n=1 Tax=Halictus rubicundus TaxID=77578 RepID=UPI0040371F65